ncbi:hypothetical protein LG347_07650 [Lactiplantibacillus plantarum]|nr:hypothetical protein [Lactiplantibacillus plantarum]MCB7157808.1 hypothetical protein [Lactiplantibacillus plantarum]MCB7165496.1 hypothetical protein [Lactiplantibacillus plantarum]MCB7166400.1 hypothetical protein [Lactiplantibacillus plantarum]MCB7172934.1 hypothetical protein [Lactiplantibacillus plantarum]
MIGLRQSNNRPRLLKVKTTAEPALPANNEHTSAAKAAATPVTRVTDTTADTLPQTGERDRSAQQGAVVLGD